MTKARDIADFKFENIVDTGTEGTKVALGTTAQRGSTQGQIRFNSTTNLAEYYDGTQFKSIDAPPTVSSISPTTQTGANANIVITGSNFASGATVKFIGTDAVEISSPSVTVNSSTQITATTPSTALSVANEPYDIKVTNASGLSGTLADALDAGSSPTWTTASGNLATIIDSATGTHATVQATDPDGQTITYSETGGTVLSTNNLTLNSSTGAISGDPVDVNASTTHTFTLRASDGVNNTDRSFNIIVNPTLDGSTSAKAAPSATHIRRLGITENNYYWISAANGVTQKVPMILETGLSGSTTSTARGFIIAANNSEGSGTNVKANHQPRLTANTGQVGWNGNNGSLPTNGDWSAVVSDQANFSINMKDIGFDELIFMAHGTGSGDTGNWETSFGSSVSNNFVSTTITKAFTAFEFTQNIKIPTTTTWMVSSGASVNFGSNSATSNPHSYWSRSGYVPTGMPSRRLNYDTYPDYQFTNFGLFNDQNGSAPSIAGNGASSQDYPVWICADNSANSTSSTTVIQGTFSWSDSSVSGPSVSHGWDDFQDGSGMGDGWSVEGQGSNAFRGHPALILVRA